MNGIDFRLIYSLVIMVAVLSTSWLLYQDKQQSKNLRAEIHQRCTDIENNKRILRTEHQKKLIQTINYMNDHPDGAPSIGITRRDLLNSIQDERDLLKSVRPVPCPAA